VSRGFIEFVQAQTIPWSRGLYGGARTDVEVRFLSLDDETGASSTLVRYAPGWEQQEPERLAADEELLVLSGELVVGDEHFRPFDYAFWPAGYERPSMSSGPGAVAVTFFSTEPSRCDLGMDDRGEACLVEHLSPLSQPWTGNFHPEFPPGAGRRFLRQDPFTGEQTWLLGTLPLRSGAKPERHPVVEELVLLSGTLVGPLGTMLPGAYFWRPPEEWHGPFGTMTGNIELFRTIGGPLTTTYDEPLPGDFAWDPPYRPILPEPIRDRALAGYPRCKEAFALLDPGGLAADLR
jgi:hypothetical protein